MSVPVIPSFLARLTHRRIVVLTLGVLAPVALFFSLGRMVVSTDPVERADAIFVLGGTRATRAVEAQRLYQEGYAPLIVLSPGDLESAEKLLVQRGVPIQNDGDRTRDILLRLGVPPAAIVVLGPLVDNTAQEVDAIKPLADSRGWRTLIVVGDKASSRRIAYAFRRVFGTRLHVIVTANRDDPYDPSRWWATRGSFRTTFYEAPKLLAYWMGLRG